MMRRPRRPMKMCRSDWGGGTMDNIKLINADELLKDIKASDEFTERQKRALDWIIYCQKTYYLTIKE